MAKPPENTVTDRELFEWYTNHRQTYAVQVRRHKGGGIRRFRQATAWGMAQFNPRVIWLALRNKAYERTELGATGASLYNVVRFWVCLFENELYEETEEGRLARGGKRKCSGPARVKVEVPLSVRCRAADKIQEWHRLLAACHREYMEGLMKIRRGSGVDGLGDGTTDEIPDPLVVANEALRVAVE